MRPKRWLWVFVGTASVLIAGTAVCLKYREDIATYSLILGHLKTAHAHNERAGALLALGRREEAIAEYGRAIEADPMDAQAYYSRGLLLAKRARFQEAIADHTMAIEINPRSDETYVGRGFAYARLGRNLEAIADYSAAIAINPECGVAYHNRASSLFTLARNEEAIADYTRVIEIHPEAGIAYCDRGAAFRRLGKHQEAVDDFSRAIEFGPRNLKAYLNRGMTLQLMGKHAEALADYNKAIAIQPATSAAYRDRGRAFVGLGRHQEAISDYRRAIERGWQNVTTYLDLAELLLCGVGAEDCLAVLQRAEACTELDKDRLVLLYLRLLATKTLKRDTTALEPEFLALLGKDINVGWTTDMVETWLESGRVDAETKTFALDLTRRLKAKQSRATPSSVSSATPHR